MTAFNSGEQANTLRPKPPPKPSHLSVTLTGTVNTDTFRKYIKAQSTGGSFASTSGSASWRGSLANSDEDDGGESKKWAAARPAAVAATAKKTPLHSIQLQKDACLQSLKPENHQRYVSSASTIKAPRETQGEVGRTNKSSVLPESASDQKRILIAGLFDQKASSELLTRSFQDSLRCTLDSNDHLSMAAQTNGATSVEGSVYLHLREDALLAPQARQNLSYEHCSATAQQFSPENYVVGLDRYSVESTSNRSPYAPERSREPSVLSAKGSRGLSRWDMQNASGFLLGSLTLTAPKIEGIAGPSAPHQPQQECISHSSEPPGAEEFQGTSNGSCPVDFGRPARALYPIQGEAAFNELTLAAGQTFRIVSEHLKGNWALALVADESEEGGWRRGLVPEGWYILEREMLPPPPPVDESALVPQDEEYLAPVIVGSSNINAEAQPPNMEPIGGEEIKMSLSKRTDRVASTLLFVPAPQIQSTRTMPGTERRNKAQSRATSALSQLMAPSAFSVGRGTVSRSFGANAPAPCTNAQIVGSSDSDAVEQEVIQLEPQSRSTEDASYRADNAPTIPVHHQASRSPFARSFTRWSPFVASGAEDYLLSFDSQDRDYRSCEKSFVGNAAVLQQPVYEIELGPSSEPRWKESVNRFWTDVHTPRLVKPVPGQGWLRSGAKDGFISFQVTSRFVDPKAERFSGRFESTKEAVLDAPSALAVTKPELPPLDPALPPACPYEVLTVSRRFKHFVHLAAHLSAVYPLISLPPLPAKSQTKRFESAFIEERRKALAYFLEAVTRHPIVRQDEILLAFLTMGAVSGESFSCGGEAENGHSLEGRQEGDDWSDWILRREQTLMQQERAHENKNLALGKLFFGRSLHPEFSIDAEEIEIEWRSAEQWLRSVEERIIGGTRSEPKSLMDSFKVLRDDTLKSSEALTLVARSLLRVTTDLKATSTAKELPTAKLRNNEGAWCWRSHCTICWRLTARMQETANAFQEVAMLHEEQARFHLLSLHERVWSASRPFSYNAGLFEVNKETLKRYELARVADASAAAPTSTSEAHPDAILRARNESEAMLPLETAEMLASKAETVLNVTAAELDRLHAEKVEDWAKIGRDLLDEQIGLYEDALTKLKQARYKWTVTEWCSGTDAQCEGTPETGVVTSGPSVLPQLAPLHWAEELSTPGRIAPKPPLLQPSRPLLHPNAFERSVLRPVGLAGDAILGAFRLRSASRAFPE